MPEKLRRSHHVTDRSMSSVYILNFLKRVSQGEKPDYKPTIEWISPMAKTGNPKAQFIMGNMYLYGLGHEKDYTKAAKFFDLAAKQNHSKAQNSLGALFDINRGVESGLSTKESLK